MLPLSPPLNVSVVIPIYNEEANLGELVARVGAALQRTGKSFELICVDDGSRDGSAAVLEALAAQRPWLKPLYLIRNYGQSAALPVLAVRARKRAGERYAGLRTLAK